jgi:hypothetical protein
MMIPRWRALASLAILLGGCASAASKPPVESVAVRPTPPVNECDSGSALACSRAGDGVSEIALPRSDAGTSERCGPCTGSVSPRLEHELTARIADSHRCYDRELARRPGLHGRLLLQIRVAEDGYVCGARTLRDDLGDEEVAQCVLAEVGNAPLYGAVGGCVSVNAPISFVVGAARGDAGS